MTRMAVLYVSPGLLVYSKYLSCMLVSMREALSVEDEKEAIRVHHKALSEGSMGLAPTLVP